MLENGYRAYTSQQIQAVSSIRLYQSCGFSLAEIKELLSADEAMVRRAAKSKLAELGVQEKSGQLARERLQLLAKHFPAPYTNHYNISYTEQAEQQLFCCIDPVKNTECEDAINRLYHVIETLGAEQDGPFMMLIDMDAEDIYKAAVAIKTPLTFEGYECVALAAGWYLSTVHYGDYYDIGTAYDKLLCHAQEKGYRLQPPFGERYYLDAENTGSPTQYMTQIFIGLTP